MVNTFLNYSICGRANKKYLFLGFINISFALLGLDCSLPFFFLSLAPWYSNSILGVIHAIWAVEAMRITALGSIGSAFSVLLIILLARLIKGKKLERIES